MDKVLKHSVKKVQKLNARAGKGSTTSLYQQIEIGQLCVEGHAYWKANKKALGMSRDDLCEAYGYGKTYFANLIKVANVSIEDTERYIESLNGEPTASVIGLLKFLKPEKEDKPKTWYTFSVSKEIGGGGVRVDEDWKPTFSGDEAEVIASLKSVLKMLESKEPATIELLEVIEA